MLKGFRLVFLVSYFRKLRTLILKPRAMERLIKMYLSERSIISDLIMTFMLIILVLFCYFAPVNVISFIIVTLSGIIGTARWFSLYS